MTEPTLVNDPTTRPALGVDPAPPSRRAGRKVSRSVEPGGVRVRRILKHVVLIAGGLVMLYPLLWMVSSSFKPNDLIFRDPSLIPSQLDLSNYTLGWNALLHPFSHY